jgi:hypothetical protein
MHNHLMYTASLHSDEEGKLPPPGFFVTEIAFSAPRMYLAAGVTTMRTTGSVEPYTDLNIRRLIDEGQIPGPHLDVTGPYLEGKASIFPQMTALDEREQARRTVAFWAGEGATSFKAYMNIRSSKLMQSWSLLAKPALPLDSCFAGAGFVPYLRTAPAPSPSQADTVELTAMFLRLIAAFRSRSLCAPQAGQTHFRICSASCASR